MTLTSKGPVQRDMLWCSFGLTFERDEENYLRKICRLLGVDTLTKESI